MGEKHWPEYIDWCIGYRILTLILSSILYIAMSLYYKSTTLSWTILLGMLVSCLLSSWIYRRIGNRETLLRAMFAIELCAYTVFTILSGGLSSPYLWYQMSCVFVMIALERYLVITAFAALWCLVVAFLGRIGNGLSYQDINIMLGMLVVLGAFYVLRLYIGYIDRQTKILIRLNYKLQEEKRRSKSAFLQLANLYETFNLFALANPEKIVHELSILLKNSVAPSGCVLIKFDNRGRAELREVVGFSAESVQKLTEEIDRTVNRLRKTLRRDEEICLRIDEVDYDAIFIGDITISKGVLVRKKSDRAQKQEKFYFNLIDIIFSNLDTHSQMERFITMEEQNRIASEIHDTVIQKLFGVVCNLKVLENKVDSIEQAEILENINTLKRSVELTMAELRESIYGRSFTNAVNTFLGTIQLYMDEVEILSGSKINLNIHEDCNYLTPAQKIAIYRISCEAVNNAIRHGMAKNIDVNVELDADRVTLSIQDDGQGFVESESDFYEGNGLKNMRNIALLLKGNLLMNSNTGKGMSIRFSFPR